MVSRPYIQNDSFAPDVTTLRPVGLGTGCVPVRSHAAAANAGWSILWSTMPLFIRSLGGGGVIVGPIEVPCPFALKEKPNICQ